jgi:hypothetical protein
MNWVVPEEAAKPKLLLKNTKLAKVAGLGLLNIQVRQVAQQKLTKFIKKIVMNLIAPKESAKLEFLVQHTKLAPEAGLGVLNI